MKLNFNNAQFDYKPFPICYIPDFIDESTYKTLSESYPDMSKFAFKTKLGGKYSLAERNNGEFYFEFLKNNPCWKDFYDHVKSKEFALQMIDYVKSNNIDLGFKQDIWWTENGNMPWRNALARFMNKRVMMSKFEFSIMPANGGHILPHTDSANKNITLVLSFIKPGEWNEAWGGGTEVNEPKDETKTYNHVNKVFPFEEVKTLKTFPFKPNQCVLFVKTYNSWHSVAPMNGPETAMRKTVTINIESFT
jgi:hypothetical protein